MAQFARPSSDVATGLWTTTPLWSKIDEGAPGDDVTIASANNSNGDNAEFSTTSVNDPAVSTGHILRVRWGKSEALGHTINGTLELWQGSVAAGTKIAEFTVSGLTGALFQTDTYTLLAAEADAITNYADLNLQLLRTGDTGGNPSTRRSLVVDFAELEVPDAAAPDALLADDIESTSEVSTPAIGQGHALTADDVESASETGSPAIGQTHALAAGDTESASETSAPALGQEHGLFATSAESTSEVTSPALGQSNVLQGEDIESVSEVGAPAIGQTHILAADSIESLSEVASPSIGQTHILVAVSIESASEVTAPALAEGGDDLTADDIESLSEITVSALGQTHALTAGSIEAVSEMSAPSIGDPDAKKGKRVGRWKSTGAYIIIPI